MDLSTFLSLDPRGRLVAFRDWSAKRDGFRHYRFEDIYVCPLAMFGRSLGCIGVYGMYRGFSHHYGDVRVLPLSLLTTLFNHPISANPNTFAALTGRLTQLIAKLYP